MNHHRNQPSPDGITRSHLLNAAAEFDGQGNAAACKQSHLYEVEIERKLYPPHAIVALVAKRFTGTIPEAGFSAGKGTKCFQIREDAGFSILRKTKNG